MISCLLKSISLELMEDHEMIMQVHIFSRGSQVYSHGKINGNKFFAIANKKTGRHEVLQKTTELRYNHTMEDRDQGMIKWIDHITFDVVLYVQC
ncbi:hypothetical protein CHS0354_004648 [Potamilus streckersoni]|uniref:Uncharacterized protein n=1 Tax=Potamilus streckersoni TaxID=2493646 RepID=A0AAE0S521_9BIVA|nr:hypothetical protein CHS0354_004648 [Potamilus streckersoni]